MAELTLHSGLKDFGIIKRLLNVRPTTIDGMGQFESAPLFLGLEAMAQLAALHVRHLAHFKRHAFLLKVTHWDLPAVDSLKGTYHFQADLLNQSSLAFNYHVETLRADKVKLAAELIIGTQGYDDCFKQERLQAHYQNRFNQLLSG